VAHKLIGEGRALKVCDECGGVDDHPRHVIAGDPRTQPAPRPEVVDAVFANLDRLKVGPDDRRRLATELFDTSTVERHMDCCRAAGCPAEGEANCVQQTAGVEDRRGADLLEHLMTDAPAAVRAQQEGDQ
jgi:hypothetical protein